MAAKKAAKKAPKAPKKPGTKKRRGVKLEPTGLGPEELPIAEPGEELAKLEEEVRADGGAVIGAYREPLGGHTLLFAALPVEKVAPTPFQRDVSDAHVRKLTVAMDKTRRFLDPIIVVREDGKNLTPNGNHRLTAVRELGARSIVALVVPERALEVVRMYRDLAGFSTENENTYQLEFEEPALVTLGFGYESRPRLSGGAYNPVLRKVDKWIDEPIADAAKERERRAGLVLALDDAVGEAVERFKEKGLTSPYLKSFVVARINPLRFMKGEPPPLDELMATMTKRAKGLDPGKVRPEDLARSGGAPDEE
jgi:ParB family chromosome partitioning protein